MRPERNTIYLALGMLAGSAVLSLGLGSVLHSLLHLSVHDVRRIVHALGPWGAPAVTLTIAAIIVLVPIPTIPIEIVAGLVYGIVAGSALVLAGHLLGALISFAIARRFGRPLLRRWLGESAVRKLDPFTERSGFIYVFFLRLLPLFDFKLVSYAAGLTPIRARVYMAATAAGIVLPIVILDSIGATAAARPREAALIAAAYSLVVAGTVAYFLVPRRKRIVHVHREESGSTAIARFTGHLRAHGDAVPRGATVVATVASSVCGAATTSDPGVYSVELHAIDGVTLPGATVVFTVNGGRARETASIPDLPANQTLDLTVTEILREETRGTSEAAGGGSAVAPA